MHPKSFIIYAGFPIPRISVRVSESIFVAELRIAGNPHIVKASIRKAHNRI